MSMKRKRPRQFLSIILALTMLLSQMVVPSFGAASTHIRNASLAAALDSAIANNATDPRLKREKDGLSVDFSKMDIYGDVDVVELVEALKDAKQIADVQDLASVKFYHTNVTEILEIPRGYEKISIGTDHSFAAQDAKVKRTFYDTERTIEHLKSAGDLPLRRLLAETGIKDPVLGNLPLTGDMLKDIRVTFTKSGKVLQFASLDDAIKEADLDDLLENSQSVTVSAIVNYSDNVLGVGPTPFNAKVNLLLRREGYIIEPDNYNVFEGGYGVFRFRRLDENGKQLSLGSVADYDFRLEISGTTFLDMEAVKVPGEEVIEITVHAEDIDEDIATSAHLRAYKKGVISPTDILAEATLTKVYNPLVENLGFQELYHNKAGVQRLGNYFQSKGHYFDGKYFDPTDPDPAKLPIPKPYDHKASTVYVSGGTSIASNILTNITYGEYTKSTVFLLESYAANAKIGTPLNPDYFSQIEVTVDPRAEDFILAEKVIVDYPTGGKVIGLLVTAKDAAGDEYEFEDANGLGGAITVTLNNGKDRSTTGNSTPVKDRPDRMATAFLQVQTTSNDPIGMVIYQLPKSFGVNTRSEVEQLINEGSNRVNMVAHYALSDKRVWEEVEGDGNGVVIAANSSIYLVATAYYSKNDDGSRQEFIISEPSINGWYYSSIAQGNMFLDGVAKQVGNTSIQGLEYRNRTSGTVTRPGLLLSNGTSVLELSTGAYAEDETARMVFARKGGTNNIGFDLKKVERDVDMYILAPADYTPPAGVNNKYGEALQQEIKEYSKTGEAGPLYQLNVLQAQDIPMGSKQEYKVICVYTNEDEDANFANSTVVNGITLTPRTDPLTISSVATHNNFMLTASSMGGAQSGLLGKTATLVYKDANGKASPTVTFTVTKPVVDDLLVLYKDYNGRYFSANPELYNYVNNVNKMGSHFEVPIGTDAQIYVVYGFSNDEFYRGRTIDGLLKDYVMDSTKEYTFTEGPGITALPIDPAKPGEVGIHGELVPITGGTAAYPEKAARIVDGAFTVTSQLQDKVTVAGTEYDVAAISNKGTTPSINLVPPLVSGIYAQKGEAKDPTDVSDPANPKLNSGADIGYGADNTVSYIVGEMAETFPVVTLTAGDDLATVYDMDPATATYTGPDLEGEAYTGRIYMNANPNTAARVTKFNAVARTGKENVTVHYDYEYTLNGFASDREIILTDGATNSGKTYTLKFRTENPEAVRMYLVSDARWHGKKDDTTNPYSKPYVFGDTFRVYPVVLTHNMKYSPSAPITVPNYVSMRDVSGSGEPYSPYLTMVDSSDFGGMPERLTLTGPGGGRISGNRRTDATTGDLYYEFTMVGDIPYEDLAHIVLETANLTYRNGSKHFSGMDNDLITHADYINPDLDFFNMEDPDGAYLVDIDTKVKNDNGNNAQMPSVAGDEAAEIEVGYFLSSEVEYNPATSSTILVPTTPEFFDNEDYTVMPGSDKYDPEGINALKIVARDTNPGEGVFSYSESKPGVLTFKSSVAGVYEFELSSVNNAGAVVPYFDEGFRLLQFEIEPRKEDQTIYYGMEDVIECLSDVQGVVKIEEVNSDPVLDADALAGGVLKLAVNNTVDTAPFPTTIVNLVNEKGIVLVEVTVTTIGAQLNTAKLSHSAPSANNVQDNLVKMFNGETRLLYWIVEYKPNDATSSYVTHEMITDWQKLYPVNEQNGPIDLLQNRYMITASAENSGEVGYIATLDEPVTGKTITEQYWIWIVADRTMEYNYVVSASDSDMTETIDVMEMQAGDEALVYIWNTDTETVVNNLAMVESDKAGVAAASIDRLQSRNDGVLLNAVFQGDSKVYIYPAAGGVVELPVKVSYKVPVYNVTGKVVDETGNEIIGATVVINDAGSKTEATTDSAGIYTIEAKNGTHTIVASYAGMLDGSVSVTVADEDTTAEDIVLSLAPEVDGYAISGTVTDEDGEAIADASVTVTDSDDKSITVKTDADGVYKVENLEDGTYTVTASKDGYEEKSATAVVAGADLEKIDLVLTAAAAADTFTVSGTVVDEDNKGILGAQVVISKDGAKVAEMLTDAAGTYSAKDLEPGSYSIAVTCEGYDDAAAVKAEVTTEDVKVDAIVLKKTPIVVPGGNYKVTGTVVDDEGTPVANAEVVLGAAAGNYPAVKTDAKGAFTVEKVEDGKYTLTVSKEGYTTATAEVTVDKADKAVGEVRLNRIGVYDVTVTAGENGSASADKETAQEGDTVTVTVKPDRDYVLDAIQAVDGEDEAVALTKKSETIYTFVMTASDVKVTASFKYDRHNCPSANFTDVITTEWYHEWVDAAVEAGIMAGTSETIFAPNVGLTRGMIVQILYNLEGKPSVDGLKNKFTDVPETGGPEAWFRDAVVWAESKGIVYGTTETTYGPLNLLTREQMVRILYKYAEHKGYDISATTSLNGFTDTKDISDWAVEAMEWAVANEFIKGMNETTLGPKGTSTRAQVATVVIKVCRAFEIPFPNAAD